MHSVFVSVFFFFFVCLLAQIEALQNLYPTVRGHTARLLASGDAVMVCGIVEALFLFSRDLLKADLHSVSECRLQMSHHRGLTGSEINTNRRSPSEQPS